MALRLRPELASTTFTQSLSDPGSIAAAWERLDDLDGDGHPELVIAAGGSPAGWDPTYEDTIPTDEDWRELPSAWVIPGSQTGSVTVETSALGVVMGLGAGALLGTGDTNGDGYTDLLFPCSGCDSWYSTPPAGPWEAFVLYGPFIGPRQMEAADATIDLWGSGWHSFVAPGDLDGDGRTDLAIGSGSVVYILTDPLSGHLQPDEAYYHHPASNNLRVDRHSAGDLNGDGTLDLVVGDEHYDDRRGLVLVLDGPLNEGPSEPAIGVGGLEHRLGRSLAVVGDTNADGYDDLVVGAIQDASSPALEGVGYLFRGPIPAHIDPGIADATMYGERESYAASVLGRPGDLDGDGGDDLLIGAPGDRSSEPSVYVVSGSIAGVVMLGETAEPAGALPGEDGYGEGLAGLGDLDGDGVPDLLVHQDYRTLYRFSGADLPW